MSEEKTEAKAEIMAFGAQIKKARTEKNLDHRELADDLKISVQLLDDLEQMRLDQLPAPAFVKGYLRSLASLLDLDADQLVANYSKSGDKDPDLGSTASAAKQWKFSDPVMKWSTALIALILVILLLVWIVDAVNQKSDSDIEVTPEVESSPDALANSIPVTELTDFRVNDLELVEEQTGSTQANQDNIPQAIENESIALNDSTPQNDVLTEPALSERALDLTASQLDGAIENNNDVVVKITPNAPQGTDEISFEFSGDTWIEVQDDNQIQLIYGLLNENRGVLNVTGQAPFNVFLGNGDHVTITYKTQVFNHSKFIRSNKTARFEVK